MTDWLSLARCGVLGAVVGASLTREWQRAQERRAIRRAELHLEDCLFVGCEPQLLVTYDEDRGVSEMRGYAIIPRTLFEERYVRS